MCLLISVFPGLELKASHPPRLLLGRDILRVSFVVTVRKVGLLNTSFRCFKHQGRKVRCILGTVSLGFADLFKVEIQVT